ncbi:hypothetical protein R3I93_019962 [Phoxinus phoxinus]|uniref:PiggyBac transposable element-derived protein domain-containing protein n=1 Tax=Phoxinus phoxinus TaxID=58324 RepID=A0AAN9CE59_9TELE
MKKTYTTTEAIDYLTEPTDSEPESDGSVTESASDDDVEFQLTSDSNSSSDSTQSEELDDTQETADPMWTSKNGLHWSPTNAKTLRYVPAKVLRPGPTHYATARIVDPRSAFQLLFTEEMVKLIVDRTNLQGRRSETDWINVDATEVEAYLGVLILAGVYKSRNESTQWDDHTGRPIFRATMPHRNLQKFISNVRFDDRLTRPGHYRDDKLAAFRPIWDKWLYRLPLLFNPGVDVCVDEQLVGFRGRCIFRQYIPSKPAKYGIKIWVTSDVSTSYAWKMQIYAGKSAGCAPEVKQGQRVVRDMTDGLEGHTVTTDNFFTSYALAEELLKKKKELPPHLLQTRARAPRSSEFAFRKTTTAVSYVPKRGKNLLLLSTKHREPAVSGEEHQKPVMIMDYNRCKGAVDSLDKGVGAYSCKRKTSRWPMTLFYNLIDVSAINAFVLRVAVDPSWNQEKTFKRRLFLEELGRMLVYPQMKRRERLPCTPAAAAMVQSQQRAENSEASGSADTHGKRRRGCSFCTNKRRKISTTCSKCGIYICKEHALQFCSSCK